MSATTSHQEAAPPASTTPTRAAVPLFRPRKADPEGAEQHVRAVFRCRPNNLDLAAAELAPLYGLGAGASADPLARMYAAALFSSPALGDPLGEFLMDYLQGRWGMPVAKWPATLALVLASSSSSSSLFSSPEGEGEGTATTDADRHYARFILAVEAAINGDDAPGVAGTGRPASHQQHQHLRWLRGAPREDVAWVLFHALMYLQLDCMQWNRRHAPLGDFTRHYVTKMVDGMQSLRGRDSDLTWGDGRDICHREEAAPPIM
ncbi:hypothetical protein GGR56DRAFT_696877 [Xylariaceae sp. FL0804]|nr:hypothetical protein GGR56DRAFT_696877 [Xylariaceae sp. FL0804]